MRPVLKEKKAVSNTPAIFINKNDSQKYLLTKGKALRNCCIILVCLLSFHAGFSQDKPSKLSFGLKVGMGRPNMGPSYTDTSGNSHSFRSIASISAGIRLFVPIGKKIVLLPEMITSIKGVKESVHYSSYDYSEIQEINLIYIEIPLNVTYKIATHSGMFLIGGGPSTTMNYFYSIEHSPFKNADVGLNLISCYQFPVGFSIELNYYQGFLNTCKGSDKKIKKSDFSVSIGYAF